MLVFSFTTRPLYSRGKSPGYPFYKRLGVPQSQSGRCREEKISCPYRYSNPGRPAPTELQILMEILVTQFPYIVFALQSGTAEAECGSRKPSAEHYTN
jgi:hypothetical protein